MVAHHVVLEESDGGERLRFDYFDCHSDEDLVKRFFWLLQTHNLIIEVFAAIFSGEIEHRREIWSKEFQATSTRIERHFHMWQQRFPMRPSTSMNEARDDAIKAD
jgi:hypothetical protein